MKISITSYNTWDMFLNLAGIYGNIVSLRLLKVKILQEKVVRSQDSKTHKLMRPGGGRWDLAH